MSENVMKTRNKSYERWEGQYKKRDYQSEDARYGHIYGRNSCKTADAPDICPEYVGQDDAPQKDEICFGEVCTLWLENNMIRYKGATIKKYHDLIETHIIPELGDIKLSQMTAPMINAFLKRKMESGRLDRKGGLAPSYVRSIMLVVSSVMDFVCREQMCPPLKTSINKPKSDKKTPVILDEEKQRKLEKYISTDLNATKVGILITLNTGLRIGEVCALSWDDIDFENRIMYVRHTVARVSDESSRTAASKIIIDTPKTSSSIRYIPISSSLFSILKKAKEISTSPYVISDREDFLSPRTFEYRYHRILEKCGIEHINYHALRHTFATRCIKAGVDVKTLSEILGHSNVSVTLNTYVHSSMEMKRIQLEKLSSLS